MSGTDLGDATARAPMILARRSSRCTATVRAFVPAYARPMPAPDLPTPALRRARIWPRMRSLTVSSDATNVVRYQLTQGRLRGLRSRIAKAFRGGSGERD
eukprot:3423428-Rhodomonas_salina.3